MNILTLDDSWVSSLQKETIEKMLRTCKHGAARIDVTMRVDGREYTFEADWIKAVNKGVAPHMRENSLVADQQRQSASNTAARR